MTPKKGSLKSTLAVSLNNYLDAGAIVAGASWMAQCFERQCIGCRYWCHNRWIPGR